MSDKDEKRRQDAVSAGRDPDLAEFESTLQDLAGAADDLVDGLFEPEPVPAKSKLSDNPLSEALGELSVDERVDALQLPQEDDAGTLSVVLDEGELEPAPAPPLEVPTPGEMAAETPSAERESVWTSPAAAGPVGLDPTEPLTTKPPESIEPIPIMNDAATAPEPDPVETDTPRPVAPPAPPTAKDRPLFSEPARGPTPRTNYLEQAPRTAPVNPSGGWKPWLVAAAILFAALAGGGMWWQSSRARGSDASVRLTPTTRAVTLAPASPIRSTGGEGKAADWPPPPPRPPESSETSPEPAPTENGAEDATSKSREVAPEAATGSPTPRPDPVARPKAQPAPPKIVAETATPKPQAAPPKIVAETATPKPQAAPPKIVAETATPKPQPAPPKIVAETATPKPQPAPQQPEPGAPGSIPEMPAPRSEPPEVETLDRAPDPVVVPAPTPAVMIQRVEPIYPETSRKKTEGGVVKLEALVGENGRVLKVLVKQGVPGSELEGRAIDALLRSTYRPATRDGKPYETWVTETYVFDR